MSTDECVDDVPPDHPLQAELDASEAAWLFDALEPWELERGLRVAALVPDVFEAVVQVLHPWGDAAHPVRWSAVAAASGFSSIHDFVVAQDYPLNAMGGAAMPAEGQLDRQTAEVLVDVLGSATSTPDDVVFAVWPGWGDIPPTLFPGAAEVRQRYREYFLLRGPIDGLLAPLDIHGWDETARVSLWWPRDREWVAATEIDFSWTFVAGSEQLAQRLLATEDLEVLRTSPSAWVFALTPRTRDAHRTD